MNCAKPHIVCVVLWLVMSITPSVWADRTDFLVNDDGGITEQNHPRIAVAGDGGFVIAWVDKRAGSSDIFLQRYMVDGTKLGSNIVVNDDGGYAYQSEPAIAVDLSGLYSVVWKDYRQGSYPFDPDIYFQRYDTSLIPVDTNRVVTVEQPDSLKETPDIALSPWGGGVVVWADYRNRNWDIYGQLIASNGSPTGSNFRVNDDIGTAQQHMPRVAVSPEGWFVIVWYDNRLGDDDIFVQRFNSLAQPLGINVRVNSDTEDDRQAFPDVATDGAGHFTVVWVDWRNGVYPSNPDIYARKFDTTMAPVTDDEQVNQDSTTRAQREPTIAADRRGNVSIIWSDSSGTSQLYDIVGQMIDVDGVICEVNFQANSEADSAQFHADVALDGRYRYITWADKRNGNYDIYASITRYNDPTLVPSPTALRFEMLRGEGTPVPQELTIDHYGYNSLDFTLLASHDWFEVTPSGGMTPATISVAITTDTLPFGTYIGALTLYDIDNDDSTVQISVRLDVIAPILDVGSDTLSFLVYSGMIDSAQQLCSISNEGAGDLNWTIAESLDWLTVEPVSGTNSATLAVWVNGLSLPSGNTNGYFEIIAPDAVNSPDTVWINVEAVDNQPYIRLVPPNLSIATEDPAGQNFSLQVTNVGVEQLAWIADPGDTWLQLDRAAGIDNDPINLTFDTAGFSPGLHLSWIDITDSSAFHPVERFDVVLDYLIPGSDTVTISDILTEPLAVDSFAVHIQMTDTAAELHLPLSYDPDLMTIDSVCFVDGLASSLMTDYSIDPVRGVVNLSLVGFEPDSLVMPGSVDLGWVHFTAGSNYGLFDVGEPSDSDLAVVLVTPSGSRLHPETIPGEIRVEEATAVDDLSPILLPLEYTLSQNYPNPFNPQTTIEFGLPTRSDIELEVFNILGQRIRLLLKETLPAGNHKVMWDGKYASGVSAPSGIYFYRIRTGNTSLVRKMMLVK
ncbi:MAG: T9SS type A sorting domain-containing protein [candidate division Zixibacteria bacterium]|nr:T9SS type A sorting domain-containing protein [candidate division Zixibacteria bacterium]